MTPKKVTIHSSDTPNGRNRVGGWAQEIRRWHMEERKWSDIGYHLVINPNGQVEMGRPMNRTGAHVAGHNASNLGIVMVGTDMFTGEQWERLKDYLHAITQSYDIYPENFYTHNQFNASKICPGFSVNQLLTWYCAGRWESIRRNWIKNKWFVKL